MYFILKFNFHNIYYLASFKQFFIDKYRRLLTHIINNYLSPYTNMLIYLHELRTEPIVNLLFVSDG